MKQIAVAASCLVAVFAFSVTMVASASAALPEFLHCLESATGKFSTKAKCEKNEVGGTGWEMSPVLAGSNIPFTSTGGAGKLLTVAEHEIACTGVTNTGKLTGPKTDLATITFTGCKALGFLNCQTAGAKNAGEIVVNVLSLLVYINKGKEVGLLLSPDPSTSKVFTEFSCEGLETLKVEGNVLGKLTPTNTLTATYTLALNQKKGVAEPSEYEEVKGETPAKKASLKTTGSGFESFGPEGSGITSTDTITLSEIGEISA